jgi:DNA-binding NtrC family response regulator
MLADDAAADVRPLVNHAVKLVNGSSLPCLAQIEGVEAEALAAAGDLTRARLHLRRAVTVLDAIGHQTAKRELLASPMLAGIADGIEDEAPGTEALPDGQSHDGELEAAGSLVDFASNAPLMASEAIALMRRTNAATEIALYRVNGDGRTLVRGGPMNGRHRSTNGELFQVQLGKFQEADYELEWRARPDLVSERKMLGLKKLLEAAIALEQQRRAEANRGSLWPADEDLLQEGSLYAAPRMRDIARIARRIAPTDLPVLITGETGTGKEVLARDIHAASERSKKSFAVFVCSGVPRETLDSHLFGHRRGAFTGAIDNFPGVIRANEGGTLFLDEIAEISTDLQTKLLRFLETGEVHPLGETKPVKVNVRVIAATNQPVEQLLADGRFREDLYYRLNVVRFQIPPLRERREEIPPLLEYFLMRHCGQLRRPVPAVSDEALEHLLLYRWPGNVRQLYNEIRRILVTIEPGVPITPDVLAPEIVAERLAACAATALAANQLLIRLDQPLHRAVEELERAMIAHALNANGGKLEGAARTLDITRKGLFLKRQRLNLG